MLWRTRISIPKMSKINKTKRKNKKRKGSEHKADQI